MTIIADFNFEDGHELSDYRLEVSQEFPLTAEIRNNTLMLETSLDFGGELIINIEGEWAEETPVSVLLRNAQGKAYIGPDGWEIDNSSPADAEGVAHMASFNGACYLVLALTQGDTFQFTGYEIKTA